MPNIYIEGSDLFQAAANGSKCPPPELPPPTTSVVAITTTVQDIPRALSALPLGAGPQDARTIIIDTVRLCPTLGSSMSAFTLHGSIHQAV